MQIGTISIIGSMRLVKDEHTCLTPFRISNNRPLSGYALSLFADKIIKKYEILGDYGFEPFSLVFLQNLWAEADQNRELETRVEQTLRLLILWNQRHEINNQLICHQNVYLTSLRNEIEINLSYIKQLSLSQYQQLHKLYSSERAEQNLMVCKTLISQLDSADSASVRPTPMVRENQVINIVGAPTIKPHSLAQPFRTLLGNVVNINNTPGNRELFYSTTRNQLVQHLIENKMGDTSSWENVLLNITEGSLIKNLHPMNNTQLQTQAYHISPSDHKSAVYSSVVNNVYRRLLAAKSFEGSLLDPQQLQEYVQNTAQRESTPISPKVIQLLNLDRYSTLQRLSNVVNISHLPGNSKLYFSPARNQVVKYLIENKMGDSSSQVNMLLDITEGSLIENLYHVLRNSNTIVDVPTIEPHSLAQPFRTLLDKVVNISYTPSNRELFYSTVRNQLVQHFIENIVGDTSSWENVLRRITEGSSPENLYRVLRNSNTIVDVPTIEPHSLAQPFRTLLDKVVNISYTPGNRELFYSTVRNQLVQHFIENIIGDTSSWENVLRNITEGSSLENLYPMDNTQFQTKAYHIAPSEYKKVVYSSAVSKLYQGLWAANDFGGSLLNPEQLWGYIQNAAQSESPPISAKVIQLLNPDKYITLQRLNTRLFSEKQGREISHLIINRGRLSPEVLSFLSQRSLTKNELLRIAEQGTWEEKVLVFDALNYAVENIVAAQSNTILTRNLSTLRSLLKNIENNNFDFNRHYELEGASLTFKQYISREEHLTWHEIEKQVNQYKAMVSRQLNNISMVEGLLSPTITNSQLISVLTDKKDKSIINTFGTMIDHVYAHDRGSVSARLKNAPQPVLQVQSSDLINSGAYSTHTVIDHVNAGDRGSVSARPKNASQAAALQVQLSNLLSSRVHITPALIGQKYQPIYEAQKIVNNSPLTGDIIHIKSFTEPIEGVRDDLVSKVSFNSSLEPLPIMVEEPGRKAEYSRPIAERSAPVGGDQVFNITRAYPANRSGNIFENVTNKAVNWIRNQLNGKLPAKSVNTINKTNVSILKNMTSMSVSRGKTHLLNKPFRSVYKTEPQNLPRYLINQNRVNVPQQKDYYASNYKDNEYHSPLGRQTDIDHNYNAIEMILATNKEPTPEQTRTVSRMPTQQELINRFGNLIADPNIPPPELIGRQAGSLISDSKWGTSARLLDVPELVKKITIDERIIREEQSRVTEIHQKVKEQEKLINQLNQAYNQLQEEMASRISERKIASLIMKELRAKLSLDKMRYGLQ